MAMKKQWCIGIGALILLGGTLVRAQAPWPIPGAAVRFEVQISSRPTMPVAGIVAILPDGGILPKGKLRADVVDEAGKPLKADLLWHNPDEGLALVFEECPAEQAVIYISSAAEYPKAIAPLRPSLMLFVRNGGKPGLEQAHALAEKMPVGPNTYFTLMERIYNSIVPVGRDEQASSYFSGWFKVEKAGKTYFYTTSKDGSEFYIDGKLGYSWPGLHERTGGKRAEKGAWIDLVSGVHQIEYYHFTQTFPGRESQLGWQQAGESRPRDPKNPSLPNLDVTGPIEASDFVHSGVATLMSANTKQGPVAIATHLWEAILQPGQNPVCLFQFSAFGSERFPTNAVFEWDFGGGRKLKGPQVAWLYGGMGDQRVIQTGWIIVRDTGDQRVTLTVSSGNNKSTCSKIVFPKSMDPAKDPPRLSINSAEDRCKVRDLFLAMCRATPADKRPAELWNATLWEGLVAVLDPGSEYALLSELFQRSRPDILGLDNTTRWLLEDAFYDALRQVDQKLTVTWLDRFEKEEKTAARIGQWKARRVHFYIFEADNLGQARLAANEFTGAAASLKQTELAMIRMGDVELFNGQHDLARRYYAQAQELRPPSAPETSVKPDDKQQALSAEPKPKPDDKTADAADKKKGHQQSGKTTKPSPTATAPGIPQAIDTWKVSAVHASAYYSTVRSLVGQQAFIEARKTLDQWELELPLDKLAGDFPLAEAEYYLALKQFKRTQKILMIYRQSVDLSNTLPQAMKMELYCLTQLDRDKEARDLGALIIKRLPNHPLAEEVKELLATTPADGKLAVDVDAWSQDWIASEKVDAAGLADLFSTNKVLGNRIKSEPQKKR